MRDKYYRHTINILLEPTSINIFSLSLTLTTPSSFVVGTKHSYRKLGMKPKSLIQECSAFPRRSQGEAFGNKNLGEVAPLITRMLRPYLIIVGQ